MAPQLLHVRRNSTGTAINGRYARLVWSLEGGSQIKIVCHVVLV